MIKLFKEERWEYKIVTVAVLFATLFFVCRSIYAAAIAFPYPRELLEPANIELTNLFLSGKNPYSAESLSWDVPGVNYNYPFLNSLLAATISKITGFSVYISHFVISLTSIIASGVIGALMLKDRAKTTISPALAAILFMFCHWRFGYIFAVPDDLGLLAFLTTMYIAVENKIKNKPFWCAVGTTICFYIKQYFVFVIIGIFIYMWLYSRREALKLLFWTVVINALTAIIITLFCPLYWTRTLVFTYISTTIGKGLQIMYAVDQLKYVAIAFVSLFFMLVLSIIIIRINRIRNCERTSIFRVKENDATTLSTIQTIVMILPLFMIGRNDGAYLSYFLQLWIPSVAVLTLVCYETVMQLINEKFFICVYLLMVFCTLYFGFRKLPNHILTSEEIATWNKAYEYTQRYSAKGNVFYSRSLAYEGFADDNGEVLCGHDGEVHLDTLKRLKVEGNIIDHFPNVKRIIIQNHKYRVGIYKKAEESRYSMITFETESGFSVFSEEYCEEELGYIELDKLNLRVGNMPYEVAFYVADK